MMLRELLLAVLLIGAATCEETTAKPSASDDNQIVGKTTAKPVDPEIPLPAPVDVSKGVGVSEGSVHHVEIDTDGVPIVHGVVMPDDPTDTKVWRNARVLNNKLIENSTPSTVQEHGDMFVYRPEAGRVLNGDSDDFKPSQVDRSNFSPSLPYPAYYYQRYYEDKNSQNEKQQLPDTVAVATADVATAANDSDIAAVLATEPSLEAEMDEQTDGRGFNTKKKAAVKTGIFKQTPGSSYGNGYSAPISYYVPADEAKGIHDDRSPYNYEPAQQTSYYTSDYGDHQAGYNKQDYQYYNYQQAQQTQEAPQRSGYYQQSSIHPGNVIPAPADAFVIKEQTYNNGGQQFTVPVPVPKDQYGQQYGQVYPQYVQQQQQYSQLYPQYQYGQQYGQPQYSQQQQPQQPFGFQQPLDFLGAKIKEQVQKAKEKYHDLTDPVVDPLVEAGQKISTNLGLPERVHKINEKVATPSVLVPLAMAGGAALALGGLSTAIALTNTNSTAFKSINLKGAQLADKLSTLKIRARRSAIGDEDDDNSSIEFENNDERENLIDQVMSSLNGPQKMFLGQLQRTGFDQWQKTPCAKRLFCDVMVQQSDDAILQMEKRMSTFLTLLDSGVAQNVQALTADVMDGIRRRNCQAFVCASSNPSQQE